MCTASDPKIKAAPAFPLEGDSNLSEHPPPKRFIGLDIHKEFLVAIGVDQEQNQVFGPHKVRWSQFEKWSLKHLRATDAVVLLRYMFANGGPLPQPFEECGLDPSPDDVTCMAYELCE